MGLGYLYGFCFFLLVFSWVFISPKFSTKILDVPLDLLCESRFGVTLTRETLDLSLDFFLRSNHIKICSDKKTTSLLFSQLQHFYQPTLQFHLSKYVLSKYCTSTSFNKQSWTWSQTLNYTHTHSL